MRTGGVGRPAVVTGVVGVHGVDIHAREFGGEGEIELRFDVGDDELRLVEDRWQRQVVDRRVTHDVDECEQLRHVGAGLAR